VLLLFPLWRSASRAAPNQLAGWVQHRPDV